MLLEDDASLANAYGGRRLPAAAAGLLLRPLEAVRVLLDHGADPNTLARNEHIRTNALHAASASENKDEQTRYELCEAAARSTAPTRASPRAATSFARSTQRG